MRLNSARGVGLGFNSPKGPTQIFQSQIGSLFLSTNGGIPNPKCE